MKRFKIHLMLFLFLVSIPSVWAMDLNPENIQLKPGDQSVTLKLNLSNVTSSFELDAFSLVVNYNHELLSYKEIDKGDTLIDSFTLVSALVIADGKLKINGSLFSDPIIVENDGLFLKINFDVMDCGNSVLTLTDFKNDIQTATTHAGSVSCSGEESSVTKIRTSNVAGSQFSFSWYSKTIEKGWIKVGKDKELLELWQRYDDDRGAEILDDIHHVTVKGLVPETLYFVEIYSGSGVDNNNGLFYSVKTGPELIPVGSCRPAGIIYKDYQKTELAYDTIVYVSILDASGNITSSTNSMIVTPETHGFWFFDLVNIRSVDLKESYPFICNESSILVEAQGGNDGNDQLTEIAVTGNLLPDMILDMDHVITATHGDNGSIDPSGQIVVTHHASKTFVMQPDDCFQVKELTVDGETLGKLDSYTFKDIEKNHHIHVEFEQKEFYIDASSGENGTISPSGNHRFLCGSTQTYSMIPDSGYKVKDVKINGVSKGAILSHTFSDIRNNYSITVEFEKISVKIMATASQGGYITPDGEIFKQYGDDQEFKIFPNDCYLLKDVIVDNTSMGAINTYLFKNITENHTIHAIFEPFQYTITASSSENGSIEPSGIINVDCGQSKTFSFKPISDCYYIYNVTVDGNALGQINEYTFLDVRSSHHIYVSFKKYSYSINASANYGGKIEPSGVLTADCASNHIFKITPDSGFSVYDVLINGTSIGPASTYTVNNLSEDLSITANFAAIYSINEGWNLLTIIMEPENQCTSKNLLESININGNVTLIQKWNNGFWYTYRAGDLFGDFNIEMGKGYFLYSEKKSIWLNHGTKWEGNTYNIHIGYNLLGFPTLYQLKASDLASLINESGGNITSIRRWDGGGLESYSVGAPFGDFQILNKEGYFLYSTQKSTFNIVE